MDIRMVVRMTVFGTAYGALTFVAGFVFGAIRELVLIPNFGSSIGHLVEFPLMLVAVGVIAGPLVRRSFIGSSVWAKLALGLLGVIVLVGIESTFALFIMGIPLGIYLDSYVVAKGALFPLGLLWMAATPTVLGWR